MISIKIIKPNFTKVVVGNLTFWFSYETVIAFEENGLSNTKTYIAENVFSNTTGKHLNMLDDDKSKRTPWGDFQQKLNATLRKHGL